MEKEDNGRKITHLMWNKRDSDVSSRTCLDATTSRRDSVVGDLSKLESNVLELGVVVKRRLYLSLVADHALAELHSIGRETQQHGQGSSRDGQLGSARRRVTAATT